MSKMEKTIYLPNADEVGKMIEDAWQDFRKKAGEAGYDIVEEMADGWVKDAFAAGYSYGHNDTLVIIRDQLNVENEIKNILD